MGYPVYKLLRAVNRQYPNNGFINFVDVREDMYDTDDEETNKIIDEDLRDLINETLQEVYIHVARDEVYSFPTVPGQREYVLPDDCDLRDIQEVTRTFRGWKGPMMPPPQGLTTIFKLTFYANGGTGEMTPIEAEIGTTVVLPECTLTPPEGYVFSHWDVGGKEYNPGDEVSVYANLTIVPIWIESEENDITLTLKNITPSGSNTNMTIVYQIIGESDVSQVITTGQTVELTIQKSQPLSSKYSKIEVYNRGGDLNTALDLTASYTEDTTLTFTQWIFDETYTMTLKNVTNDSDYITIKAKVIDGDEVSADLYYNQTATYETGIDGTFGSVYEYIAAYYEGTPFISFDMTEVLTRDVTRGLAHPSVTPGPEEPGDNNDGGNTNPLEDLIVSPIDDGNGGYGDNPLGGDDNTGSGASPSVEPDPEEPIGGD